MDAIIEDMPTLARQGETVADPESVALADLVDRCWRMVETDGATLRVAEDLAVRGDPDRLRNVFEYLFRNSVEHSSTRNRPSAGDSVEHGSTGSRTESGDSVEHGGTDVTVSVGRTDEGVLYVEDDGPGIPEAERDAVLETGHTSVSGGTGFGLTIVRRIAGAHGWDVAVTDGSDGGVRVEFTGVEFVE